MRSLSESLRAGSRENWCGRGYGIIGDLILGLLGGLVGGWIFTELGIHGPNGTIGAILVATIGAIVLVWISHIIREA